MTKMVKYSNTINIAICTDDNYAQHCAVVLTSLIMNIRADVKLNIHIIHDGLNELNRRRLESFANERISVLWAPVDKNDFLHCPLPEGIGISLATWYRLKMDSLLPDVDRVLYLDCDVIVRTDVTPLWETPLDDYLAAGVPDGISTRKSAEMTGLPAIDGFYANAGVMLINLKRWRDEGLQEFFFRFVAENSDRIRFPDQDVLNYTMAGQIKELDRRWNVQYMVFADETDLAPAIVAQLRQAGIVHFITTSKPWSPGNHHPLRFEYLKYLKQSPYADRAGRINRLFWRTFLCSWRKTKTCNRLIVCGMTVVKGIKSADQKSARIYILGIPVKKIRI